MDNPVGAFLRSRRERLVPAELGIADARGRRTPGLRRTEVAGRADISVEWYTRLEQGRGGSPSPQVLDAVATALALDGAEREHLFLLARGSSPSSGHAVGADVRDRMQRVVDGLPYSPAFVRSPSWDVVVWNRAAAAVLTDYGALPPARRNVLRILFLDPSSRQLLENWAHEARLAVANLRLAVARSAGDDTAAALIAELRAASPEFAGMWDRHDVATLGEGIKRIRHPRAGRLTMQYSSYGADSTPGLGLVVYSPVGEPDRRRVAALLADA